MTSCNGDLGLLYKHATTSVIRCERSNDWNSMGVFASSADGSKSGKQHVRNERSFLIKKTHEFDFFSVADLACY